MKTHFSPHGAPFEGVIPALLTPFLEGGQGVDEKALEQLCAFSSAIRMCEAVRST